MKKLALCFALLCLLCGCGRSRPTIDTVQTHYASIPAYSAVYEAVCDFGAVVAYTCSYNWDESGTTVTILAPEEVSGLTAVLDSAGNKMVYADIEIATYLPENSAFSPVGALHGLLYDLKSTRPTVFTATNEQIALTFEDGDWCKKAVLSADGTAIVSCEFFYKDDMILNISLQ